MMPNYHARLLDEVLNNYRLRLTADFILTFAAEILIAAWAKALVGNVVTPAVCAAMILPWLYFASDCWFIDERSTWRRAGYKAATSLGCGVGTGVVILFWP